MNIKDVAKKSGVSISTVSRVITGSAIVKEETKKRVMQAMEELEFSPNHHAQALINKKSRTIGLILPNLSIPYFTEIVHGVEKVAYENGYILFISNTNYSLLEEENRLQEFTAYHTDGVIIASGLSNPSARDAIIEKNMPVVFINRELSCDKVDCIFNDNYQGAKQALYFLKELGHKKIGIIAGDVETEENHLKLEGCMAAIEELGLTLNREIIFYGRNTVEAGMEGAEYILKTAKPTAIFAFSDAMAVGGINAVYKHGLSVPQDISFIGYNNSYFAKYFSPSLTSIDVRPEELGEKACRRLLENIEKKGNIKPVKEVLKVNLVKRNSTKNIDS